MSCEAGRKETSVPLTANERAGEPTYTLDRRRNNLEVRRNIVSEDSRLERLDVTSDVRLRLEEMAVIHVAIRLNVTVREDDVALPSFDLYGRKRRGKARSV